MTSRTTTLLSFCILGAISALYATSVYIVYSARSEQVVTLVPQESTEGRVRTKRVQSKIEEPYLVQDDAAKIFDILDAITKDAGIVTKVESVTNPQVASKGKLVPISFIDAKVVMNGPIPGTLQAVAALEALPTLTRVTDIEVAEDLDAAQPKVTVTVRFYVRNTQ
jgi:hypothetical protein